MIIFWDFNGTILDDKKLCLKLLNDSLIIENKPTKTMRQYLNVFMFPVKEYYKKAGFDFDKTDFNILANRFNDWYLEQFNLTKLTPNVKKVLEYFKNKGYTQNILSASMESNLINQVHYLKIEKYFNKLIGIEDIYAKTKIEVGRKYILENNIDVSECIMIGDTIHDAEVAEALGMKIILYSRGHMSKHRLKGYETIDNLLELTKIL
jgi:phosphoglycolate phosphatase